MLISKFWIFSPIDLYQNHAYLVKIHGLHTPQTCPPCFILDICHPEGDEELNDGATRSNQQFQTSFVLFWRGSFQSPIMSLRRVGP